VRIETPDTLLSRLEAQLQGHAERKESDPQANPVKLLAYDISKEVEERTISFRTIEELIKQLSDAGAVERAQRLAKRAGLGQSDDLDATLAHKASAGWDAFKAWAERAGLGIVLTAHPTFSLSRDIRDTLCKIATEGDGKAHRETLASLPYLPKRAPTLWEEHDDAQWALKRIQDAVDVLNQRVLTAAREHFPDQWTTLTPRLINVYSWVGYDIDGRTDISWGDAIRLRLQEKLTQLSRYVRKVDALNTGDIGLDALHDLLRRAEQSAAKDLLLFQKDISDPENLVAAANNLTRKTDNRLLNMEPAYALIDDAIKAADSDLAEKLVLLRARMHAFALGTSRIHFRLNSRHVIAAVRGPFGMGDQDLDTRTLLERAAKVTEDAKPVAFNFATLALERSTAHQQLILTAQIARYIDNQTPIRFLIAETEDAIVPLGLLYLARLYGVDNRLDISPLFETRDALSSGGRVVEKMLSIPVYRNYVKTRGVFAVQTGFSDAGRFMGQIPATLAVERLQSHLAREMKRAADSYGLTDIQTIVFNTHGEGLGRGGHPGSIKDRSDYVMSPWARLQYEERDVSLCTETSFQGGDGFLWFNTPELAEATVRNLVCARYASTDAAKDDPFYHGRDFSWDIYRTLRAEQESLYDDPNYVTLLGGFGQNLLIPTGSRAAKRKKSGSAEDMFDPRQLRAIPHNAILQQFATPANIIYGVGKAAAVEPERFVALLQDSARMQSLFSLVRTSFERTDLSCLTGYGRLFDPGFWISRALSGVEPRLCESSVEVSDVLRDTEWRSQIMDLSNRLRQDLFAAQSQFDEAGASPAPRLQILHALRLAVVMKMMITVTHLPAVSEDATSRINVLKRLQTFQIDAILEDLRERYPAQSADLEWTKDLTVESDVIERSGDFAHIVDDVIKPLARASDLVRQITIALTHGYDAFG
jgi:phosphoenolpyruvate carboxylase